MRRVDARAADRVVAWASALCAIECALAPLVPLVLPPLAAAGLAGAELHAAVAPILIPGSALVLAARARRHRDGLVLALGGAGLSALTALLLSRSESVAAHVLTVAAGAALALAHLRSGRLCARCAREPSRHEENR